MFDKRSLDMRQISAARRAPRELGQESWVLPPFRTAPGRVFPPNQVGVSAGFPFGVPSPSAVFPAGQTADSSVLAAGQTGVSTVLPPRMPKIAEQHPGQRFAAGDSRRVLAAGGSLQRRGPREHGGAKSAAVR
jgi:hypothetical protein